MKKYIGIGLVLGLVVSMYVVNNNQEVNTLTVESDYLFLNDNIKTADDLLKLEEKKEETKSEDLIWLKD